MSMGRLCKSSKSARKARLLIVYRGKVNQHVVSRSFPRHVREFPRGRFTRNRPPVRSHSRSAGKYRRYGRSVMLCKERGIETNVSKRYVTATIDLPGLRKTFVQGFLAFFCSFFVFASIGSCCMICLLTYTIGDGVRR